LPTPKRPDPRSVLERERNGTGREAVYGGSPAAASTSAALSYEDRHKRVTFHCPLDLLDALEAEMSSSGRKKNTVIVDALRAHLKKR
jgi:hypothetical protein